MTAPRGTIRTGGRTERIRQLVANAVLEIIRDGNFHFDIKEISDKTGINKSTIYRRWPTRDLLFQEALKEHNSLVQIVDTGKWRSDLLCLGMVMRKFFSDPSEMAFNAALAITQDTQQSDLAQRNWEPINEQMDQLIKRAKARGEIPEDLNGQLIANMLISTLLVSILLNKRYPSDEFIIALVDRLVAASMPSPGAQ